MNKEFYINTKAAPAFMFENLVTDRNETGRWENNPLGSVYHFMKDEFHLKKSCGIKPGTKVTFYLEDYSNQSQKKLVNTYEYFATEYDSTALLLKLTNFKIEIK